jgi:hypothetical protein
LEIHQLILGVAYTQIRYAFVTNAMKEGRGGLTVIMKLTGQKILSMFTRYNSVDAEDVQKRSA